MNRQTGARVYATFDFVARRHVAVNSVFRAKKRNQLHIRGGAEDVDGGLEVVVYAGGVGEEADAFSA